MRTLYEPLLKRTASLIMSVPDGALDSLFKARLRDNGIEYSDDDYRRFCRQVGKNFASGTLDLSGQRIGINTLTKLTKVLRTAPMIRVFNLYANLIRDHGINSLLQLLIANSQVEVLDIGCNDLTNRSVAYILDIIRVTRVRSLQLGASDVAWHTNKFLIASMVDILTAVNEAERIECLGLRGLKMSERQGSKRNSIVQSLADFVANDEVLSTVTISDNGFTLKEQDVVTAQGLLLNNHLRVLNFHDNILQDPVGPNFLGQMGNMENLMYLDIHSCQLSENAGIALAESLLQPNKIIILNIADNELGDVGSAAILEAVSQNQHLMELDISGNHMSGASSDVIGRFIRLNDVMHTVNMSRNPLGDSGAFAIAESLRQNDSLCQLHIASCKISDEGAVAVAQAMEHNACLRILRMKDNFLTRECGYKIVEFVKGNECVVCIDISSSQVNHFVIKALKELCQRNMQIQKEIDLQPLKKQLVQLSIQRTKMPEAESRLRQLATDRGNVEQEVEQTEYDRDETCTEAESNVKQLQKQIQVTREMIVEEEKAIEKIAIDKEKMEKDYTDRHGDIMADTEKEKVLLQSVEAESAKLEQSMVTDAEEAERVHAELTAQLEQLQALVDETREISEDEYRVRDYEKPELPPFMQMEPEKVFLNDELLDLKEQEDQMGKKKKKKGRKASPRKGSKKNSSRKGADEDGPAPAAASSARKKVTKKRK